jgi:hypothetical protein
METVRAMGAASHFTAMNRQFEDWPVQNKRKEDLRLPGAELN